MGLDIDSPEPPDLTNRDVPSGFDATEGGESDSDLHRGELEEILQEGAWNEAFQEWAEYTGLSIEEYRSLRDSGLVEQMDFYWNPLDERLRFEIPPLPEEWGEELAAMMAAELTDLGQTVIDMLVEAYISWGGERTPDVFWSDENTSEEPPPEE